MYFVWLVGLLAKKCKFNSFIGCFIASYGNYKVEEIRIATVDFCVVD